MRSHSNPLLALLFVLTVAPTMALAQGAPDSGLLIAQQKAAIKSLAWMDGVWRGPAWTILPSGEKHEITQTERVGPMLDGSIKVIEGRGYDAGGKVTFNAFGIVTFNTGTKKYTLHSHAMGFVGDFELAPNDSGYVWQLPAGPGVIRYVAVVHGTQWRESGYRVFPGQEPVHFFEMNLKRVRDSDWPASGAISAK